jgi:hypothetical protein
VAMLYILWSFGIFCGHLVYLPRFGMLYQEKSGNPDSNPSCYLHSVAKMRGAVSTIVVPTKKAGPFQSTTKIFLS